jgi:hypothetical protein
MYTIYRKHPLVSVSDEGEKAQEEPQFSQGLLFPAKEMSLPKGKSKRQLSSGA